MALVADASVTVARPPSSRRLERTIATTTATTSAMTAKAAAISAKRLRRCGFG